MNKYKITFEMVNGEIYEYEKVTKNIGEFKVYVTSLNNKFVEMGNNREDIINLANVLRIRIVEIQN